MKHLRNNMLFYHCHNSAAPSNVSDMPQKKPSHSRNTHSCSHTMPLLNRPALTKATLGDRSFTLASSSVWISIPTAGVSRHSHHLRLALIRTSFVQFTKTEHLCLSLYIYAWYSNDNFCQLFLLNNAFRCMKFEFITTFSLFAYFNALVCNPCIFNVVYCIFNAVCLDQGSPCYGPQRYFTKPATVLEFVR